METFLATLMQVFVRLAEMHGVDAQALLRKAGLDSAVLRDPTVRIPSSVADAVFVQAAAQIPDPAFALRAARCWHPSNLGVLGHAWLASETLAVGLRRLERYNRILGEKAQIKVTHTRDGLRVIYDHRRANPLLRAIGTDFVFSLIVDMCRMNYGASLRPVEVRLSRARPADAEPYRHFFGCPVQFGSGEDSFLLSHNAANEQLPSANQQLAGALDDMLTAELAAHDRDNIIAQCQAKLLKHFASGEMPQTEMAKALHMSPRTLQRKLAEADTTYQKLVDDTRRVLALRYIEDPHRPITDVAFSLGFSSQSAFTRAFRRWAGMPPSDYRKRKLIPAAA